MLLKSRIHVSTLMTETQKKEGWVFIGNMCNAKVKYQDKIERRLLMKGTKCTYGTFAFLRKKDLKQKKSVKEI